MAEKKENEVMETDPTEENSGSTSSDNLDKEKEGASTGTAVDKSSPKDRPGIFGSLLKYKWSLMFLLLIILAITGFGLKFSPRLLNRFAMEKHVIALSEMKDDDLKEEVLAPFFIPLSPDSPMTVVRIDLSVICDGLASVLYRKKELQIRDRLYRDITTLADGSDDLESRVEFLEMRLSMTFKEILGLHNLFIRIKEIKYF